METRVLVSFFRLHPSRNINLTFGVVKNKSGLVVPNEIVSGDDSVSDIATRICNQFIDAEPEWLECRPITFIEDESVLYLVYTVGVPYNVSAKGGLEWITYAEIMENRDDFLDVHLKSLSYCTGV